jgi:hypothetical protein
VMRRERVKDTVEVPVITREASGLGHGCVGLP